MPLLTLSAGRVAAPLADAAGQTAQNAPTSVPEPVVTGGPSLELTWADDATHVGVAVGLTIQARGADGQATTRTGTAVVALDDDRAEVRTAAGAAITGSPSGSGRAGQYFSLPVNGGRAEVSVRFGTPGQHAAFAALLDDTDVGGASGAVQVAAVFFQMQGPAGPAQHAKGRYTVTARDADGGLVAGFVGTAVVSTTDASAYLADPAGTSTAVQGTRAVPFTAADQGSVALDITFAAGGAQRVRVRQGDGSARGDLPVSLSPVVIPTVTPTATAAPTATPTATSTPTATATPAMTPTPTTTPGTPTVTPTASATATVTPSATAAPTSTPSATTAPTASPTAAPTATPAASPTPVGTAQAGSARTTTNTATVTGLLTADRVTVPDGKVLAQRGNPYFSAVISQTSTTTGVPLSLTVTALDGNGVRETGYTGTVQFTSTDAAFAPGTAYRYTFTAADAGQHVFPVTFNTAGVFTVTVIDTVVTTRTGASAPVGVAETRLTATFAASSAALGAPINLTVQATTGRGGAIVTGYRGRVQLSASNDSVAATAWGTGVDGVPSYSFTAGDNGTHVFTPSFRYAGNQTVTITDMASGQSVTTTPIAVGGGGGNPPPPPPATRGAWGPSAVRLADGSVVWAYLSIRGRLQVRRDMGTLSEPAWRPMVTVREVATGNLGADSPSIVRLGNTLALFHSYTDGTQYQAWVTTSTDSGLTWGTPTNLTTETVSVQRVQAVVAGTTVYVFFSRQDTSGQLSYRTSTDLTNWTAQATVGQSIGSPVQNTTSNFGITKLASGSWLLGWVAPSAVGEAPVAAGDTSYPVVQVATSTDLVAWSGATELSLAYSQKWPKSVAVGQDPATATIYALYEQVVSATDTSIVQRTSTNGTTWAAQTTVGYDRATATGSQGYTGSLPAIASGGGALVCGALAEVARTGAGIDARGYGHGDWAVAESGTGVTPIDCVGGAELLPLPYGDDPRTTGAGGAVAGFASLGGADLAAPGRGIGVAVARGYQSYDAITGQAGPFGYGWSWTYSARAVTLADGSVTIIEGSGSRSVFFKNGSAWTAGPGINATLTVGGGGGYVVTRRDQTTLSFNAGGRLTSITDRNSNTLTLTYSGANLASVAAPGGRGLTITTNAQGRITQISLVGSQPTPALAVGYTYDAAGNLATATDAAGAVTRYTYDARHQLLTVVDPLNRTAATLTYGTLGRVAATTNAVGQTWTAGYAWQGYGGSFGLLTKTTEPRGFTTEVANSAGWRVVQRDLIGNAAAGYMLLARSTATYNANGDVLTATDPLGRVTSFTYDLQANVLTATVDAALGGLGLTTTFTYSTANDLLTVRNPLNQTVTNTYDSRGNLLTVTDPLGFGHTTTFAYTTSGQVTAVTDATSRTTTYGYNAAGDRTSVTVMTVAGAVTTTTAYDGAGRPTSVTDPLGHTTTATYDARGRVLTATNALGHTTTATYDAAGNKTMVTDPLGRVTRWAYDNADRLTSVTDAMNGVTSYTYDQVGNRLTLTNPRGAVWTSFYDGLNRVTSERDPNLQTTTYQYDAAGNLIQTQKPTGAQIFYTYDRVYRPTAITPTGMTAIGYAYDNAGRRTSMTDGTGMTMYSYDAAGRLTSMGAPVTGTVGYSYDNANRLTGLSYPGGRQVTYGYDPRGLLASVTDAAGVGASYSYDAAGRRTGTALGNGMPPSVYAYDNADRLTSITHTYLDAGNVQQQLLIGYTYDTAGNKLTMSDNRATPAGTTTYTYDSLDRLTAVVDPASASTSYGYDAAGNRTSITTGGSTITSTFDALNRLLSDTSGATYTYDANGNQLTKSAGGVTTTYTYDTLDRMTGLTGGPHSAVYAYNGDGLRVSKAVDGAAAVYQTWAGLGQPRVIRDGTTDYLWSGEVIAQVAMGGTAQYAQGDGLGSMRQITDNTGHVVGSQQYDPYGAAQQQTGTQALAVPGWSIGFTGQQMDAESGLVYLRARYYNPENGRLLSQDAVGAPGNYVYANNNPTRFTDPSGKSPSEGAGGATEEAIAAGACNLEGDCDSAAVAEVQLAFALRQPNLITIFIGFREVRVEATIMGRKISCPTGCGHLFIRVQIGGIDLDVYVEAGSSGVRLRAEVKKRVIESQEQTKLCGDGQCPDDAYQTIIKAIVAVNSSSPPIIYFPFPAERLGTANSNSFIYYVLVKLGIPPRNDPREYFVGAGHLLGFPGWGPYIKLP